MGLLEFASKELIIPLVKKLAKARFDHEEELRIIRDEFFDPVSLSRMYVEPSCQHYNPADKDEDTHATSEIRAPVFRQLNDFFDGNFTSSTDGNNQLLILADAGMGKTSLLVMLKLFHWNRNWPNGIRCELLKLGNDSLDRINKLTDRFNTILLLDSLDEDPLAWGRLEQRLLELLDHTKNFRRVVISCRTQFFPEGDKDPFARLGKLEIGGFTCPMFYLSPFSLQQVEKYLEKKFPATFFEKTFKKQNQNIVRAHKILEKMHSLRMRPFLLSNIEDLMENPDANWNDYSVYVALVERWLNREEIRIRSQARKRGLPSDSLPDKQKLWDVCEVVARWMYDNRVRTLSQTDFKKIVNTFPDIELIEELEHGSKSLLNKQSDSHFRFSHYSIQEFLIVHSRNKELDTQYFTPQMWSFVEHADWPIPISRLKYAPISVLPSQISQAMSDMMMENTINEADISNTKYTFVLLGYRKIILVVNLRPVTSIGGMTKLIPVDGAEIRAAIESIVSESNSILLTRVDVDNLRIQNVEIYQIEEPRLELRELMEIERFSMRYIQRERYNLTVRRNRDFYINSDSLLRRSTHNQEVSNIHHPEWVRKAIDQAYTTLRQV